MNWKDITGEEILEGDLMELFDGKGSYEWTERTDTMWEGEFSVGSQQFAIGFERLKHNGVWDIEFLVNNAPRGIGGFGTTGTSGTSSVQVFSVVIGMFKEWITTVKPEVFAFTGDKSNGKESLYGKIVNRMAPVLKQMGYSSNTAPGEGKSTFQFTRTTNEQYKDVVETATAGSTMASNFPSMTGVGGLGAGFDPDGDHGIYQKDRKKRGKLPNIIRRANP